MAGSHYGGGGAGVDDDFDPVVVDFRLDVKTVVHFRAPNCEPGFVSDIKGSERIGGELHKRVG